MKKIELDKMNALFIKADLKLSEPQQRTFEILYDMLIRYNDELDLSRLKKFNDIIIKHFIDSLYIMKLIQIPQSLIDIGTGAGFPGIPLAIMNPSCHIILAEPRHKRVHFMEMVIKELGLDNAEIYPHLVTEKSFFDVQGIITRAFETIDETMSRVNHFLGPDGLIVFMKGPGARQDLSAISEVNKNNYIIEKEIPYILPGTDYERRLVIARKITSTISRSFIILRNEKESQANVITSADNKTFKELKKIAENPRKSLSTLISGKKIITDYLSSMASNNSNKLNNHKLILFDGYTEQDPLFLDIIEKFNIAHALFILKKSLFNQIDVLNAAAPLLIADKPDFKEWDRSIPAGCSLALPFQDPANMGSVIRSAAGLGIKNIILLEGAASPYHPKAIRTSSGAIFSLNILRGPSIIKLSEICSECGIPLVILDVAGNDIRTYSFPDSFILVPGTEGQGIPPELKSAALAIPISAEVESLNAAVAASIAMYEWKKSLS